MAVGSVNTSFITKLASANSGGGDLAALKTKLNKLLKLVKELAQDDSMDANLKQQAQQLLQVQIQLVEQQIAELERRGQKGEAVPDAVKAPKLAVRIGASKPGAPVSGGVDTYA
ncbi:MAG TPA: FlxA-like family protein [Oxalicibacterium sp.]|nr:FlxA-like family protein [Oxalicibacterium sp.]